ncbi:MULTISPECIES: LacI family DNA-binding transcriptional regulator [unclassified Agromyces]|uniref:LacI family DNA-binding transcriptional regulator n=1 Tax=unclassified Agromyces TaxID=2639701 RepID=UPI003014241E
MTSADVARASGVSRTTVSYVLNRTPGVSVSDATRRRVLDAATRLGYAPSAAARTLRRGRSDLVLCVLPDWPVGSAVEAVIDRLADELAGRGMSVLVHHVRGERPLTDLLRAVTPHTVVGLAPFDPADVRAMRQAGIGVVGTSDDVASDPGATTDAAADDPQRRIGLVQAERLVAGGRRRIAYAATPDPRVAAFAEGRLGGVREACASLGLEPPVVVPVELDEGSGADAVRAWRAAGIDGVAAYNDEVALAVLAGARVAGVAVPDDLAVVGVDDIPVAALASPPLTTVWQSLDRQAAYLAECVAAELDGLPQPRRPRQDVELVPRESA